jgi:hypothetical protein
MLIMQEAPAGINTFLKAAKLAKTTQEYVVRLMMGFVFHFGRMSASQASGAVPTQARHRGQVTRFLAECRWSRDWSQCLWMATLLLEAERKRAGRWLFLLDQTYCSQQGEKTENTFSTGNRQRRPRKGRRYSKKKHKRRTVHGFVFGLLLTPGGLRLPVCKCYYTKEYCQAKSLPYRTQTQIAAELIAELSVPQTAEVVVVGDTAYEAKTIRQACAARGFFWIAPLNPERVLAGPKGQRPKVKSLVAGFQAQQFVPVRFKPGQGEFAAQRRVSRYRLGPKAKSRTFYVHQERRVVHSVGMAQLVFSTKELPKAGQAVDVQKILMTNALRYRASEVVELYDLRWQIELFFKELKSTLGWHQYRFRRFDAVETWVQTGVTTVLYLEWYRGRQLRRRDLDAQSKEWWRSQRTYGICRAVRQTSEAKELTLLANRLRTRSGRQKVQKCLRAAQPLEYRAAA